MAEKKPGFRYGIVATLSLLLNCSACNDQSAKQSGASAESPSSSRDPVFFTAVAESRNTSERCRSAKHDISLSDERLEAAFKEWRSERDAFYEARKSDFLSGADEKDAPPKIVSNVTSISTVNDAAAYQKDNRSDKELLDAKKSSFYAALLQANETLQNYVTCIEPNETSLKRREYNALLGEE